MNRVAVFDSTTLLYHLDPDAKPPRDPDTGQPVARAQERVDLLLETFKTQGKTVLIPTPVLSEVLVGAGDAGPQYLDILSNTSRFRIAPFDERAAIELAEMTRKARSSGDLRAGTGLTRAQLRFDRQILAIARVQNERHIYTDDGNMGKVAAAEGFTVTATRDLSLPSGQPSLPFGDPANA